MRRAAALLWLGAGLLCAACQRPPESGPWFPRVAGAFWVYELRSAAGSSQVRVEGLGERRIPELGRMVFLARETRSVADGFDAANPVGYVEEGGYLSRVAGLAYDGDGRLRVLGDGGSVRMLPLAPRPGLRWVQETRAFAAGGVEARQHWEAEVRAGGPVEVPAGRFGDVLEVRSTLRDAGGAVRARFRDVFAQEVGLVYGAVLGPRDPTPVEELRLLRYQIGGGSPRPPPMRSP